MISTPEAISAKHDCAPFSCGKPALDDWLKRRALSNHEKGFTAVTHIHDDSRVVAYYGLEPTAVAPAALSRAARTGQPPDPIPCLLLGQLAVDLAWKGQGIGGGLLKHAYFRCVAAARLVGGRALIVKAIDEEAAAYWRRQDFVSTKTDPMTLYRPIGDIAAAIRQAATSKERR